MAIGEVIKMWCGHVDLRDAEVTSVRRLRTEKGTKYVLLGFDNNAEANIFENGFSYHQPGGAGVSLQGELRNVEWRHVVGRIGNEVVLAYDRFVVHLKAENMLTEREIVTSVKRLLGTV